MGFTQNQALKALGMFDNNLERAANYLFDSPPLNDDDGDGMHSSPPSSNQATTMRAAQDNQKEDVQESEQDSVDPGFWKEKAQEYQKMALAAKRQGDKKKAVALLRDSKNFNQKYQDLLEIHESSNAPVDSGRSQELQQNTPSPHESSKPATPPSSSPTLPTSPSLPPPSQLSPQQEPASQSAATTTNNLQQVQDLLGKVISLQKQYKEAAIYYKGLGNLATAKQMVRTSKELLHTGIRLKNGEIVDVESVRLPEEPDMSLGDGKIRQVEPVLRGPNVNSFDQIEAQLTYQMNVCHNLSIQLASPSRAKPSSKTMMNSQQQDAYAKAEEAISADLMSLQATKPNIPPLHYEQVNYTYKNLLDTIPDNMMEFKISKAISLPTLDISSNLEPFVTWDFGGWPPENTAQAAMNKGETPVVSGINPEFNFSIQIPISRTNRLFQRYVQRKKLTVEVFHNKYSYGLFRRPVSLGKAVIPMDRLLTKSSITGTFDVK